MSQSLFKCVEHTMPAQHVRNHRRATTRQHGDEPLQLAIKQYIPLDNLDPKPGDVTLIGAHCTGYQKELYEPIWDDLYHYSARTGTFRIRSIWMADTSFQGESGILNEGKLGNQQAWMDHTRDLLLMTNTYRKEIVPPLIAFGHSMGGNNLLDLALLHPRLFTSLVLIEPVLQRQPSLRTSPFYAAVGGLTFKRDSWPSLDAACQSFRKNKFYQTWDPRVLELFIAHGLRNLPTPSHPTYSATKPGEAPPSNPVTLRTTKHAEVFGYSKIKRSAPHPSTLTAADLATARTPDDPAGARADALKNPFYRPEAYTSFWQLPVLAPTVLYINGSKSTLSTKEKIVERAGITGTDPEYGNGGVPAGAVRDVNLEGGHHVAFERPADVAAAGGEWIAEQVRRWMAEEEDRHVLEEREKADALSRGVTDECVVDETWVYWAKDIGNKAGAGRTASKQSKL